MLRTIVIATAVAASWAFGMALPSLAQDYPSHQIRISVGFGPGSTADILARLVGKHIEAKHAKPVIVENRSGNSSMIAAEQVAKAAKDGHTLFMGTVAQTLVPVRKKMDFKLDHDMAPVSLLAVVPNLMAAHPSLGVKDMQALLVLAKSKPDSLTFGTSGAGTASHLAAELFNQSASAKLVMVHYQGGSSQVLVDLIAGRINLVFNVAATLVPHVEKGALVPLGIAQPARTKILPNVPTMAEQGLQGFDAGIWIGLLAPPGTPASIVDLLAATSTEALGTEAVAKVLVAQGIDALGGTPSAFARFIADDIAKWTNVVTSAGLYE